MFWIVLFTHTVWLTLAVGQMYTKEPIEPWEANSLQELYEYMQQYLKDLMLEINKPVVECQHCNGLGCITKTIGTNERGG